MLSLLLALPIMVLNAGASAAASSGNVTPALHTTPVQEDVMVLVCASKDNVTHSAAAGWTQKLQASNSSTTQLSIWWRRYQSGDAAPLVTHTSGSEIVCQITGFRFVNGAGSGQSTDPFDAASGSYTATNASPISTTAITTATNGDMILHVAGSGIATNSANAFSAPTGIAVSQIYSTQAGATTVRATIGLYWGGQATAGSTGAQGLAFSVAPAGSSGYASALLALAPTTARIFTLHDVAAWGGSHGLAAEGNEPAVARSGTGWIAGTKASGQYSLLLYGTKRASSTFGASALPSASPTTNDTWRSTNTLNGSFASGTWPISLGFRSATAAYTGRFQVDMRVWRSANKSCSSAVEITSGSVVIGPTTANLSTSVTSAITLSWSAPAITLTEEYLCFQMAAQVTSAGGGSTQDILFMADPSTSYFLTTAWTQGATSNPMYSMDSLGVPPNVENLQLGDDERSYVLKDKQQAGDLFMFIHSGAAAAADLWYVLASPDTGTTWNYYAASNGEPNRDGTNQYFTRNAEVQDSSGYKVHHVVWEANDANVWYDRIALAYDGSGHINGWSWEAERKIGPTPNTTGAADIHLDLTEVLDANSVHRLLLTMYDGPSATDVVGRMLASVTSTSAALAPTGASDWKKITNSSTTGFDVLGAWSKTATTDAAALINFTSLSTYGSLTPHGAEVSAAQVGSNGDLHFVMGCYYYNDSATKPGKLWRWRFTASGSNWVSDAGALGAVVVADDGVAQPQIGHLFGTNNYVWLGYIHPTNGVQFDKIDSSGTVTSIAVASPDSGADEAGYVGFAVSADDSQIWAQWQHETFWAGGSTLDLYAAHYASAAWTTYQTTYDWGQQGFNIATTGGAVPFHRSGAWNGGVTAFAYGYDTYGAGTQKYHLHTLTSVAPAPPAGGTSQWGMGFWGYLTPMELHHPLLVGGYL